MIRGGAKNHLIANPDCDVEMTARDVTSSFAGMPFSLNSVYHTLNFLNGQVVLASAVWLPLSC
jgi:hypothetical protein